MSTKRTNDTAKTFHNTKQITVVDSSCQYQYLFYDDVIIEFNQENKTKKSIFFKYKHIISI